MRALILETLDDPAQMAQWFGRVMTQPKYADQLVPTETPTDPDDLVAALQEGEALVRSPGSRFAWRALDETRATLFADGDGVACALPLARTLASDAPWTRPCWPSRRRPRCSAPCATPAASPGPMSSKSSSK